MRAPCAGSRRRSAGAAGYSRAVFADRTNSGNNRATPKENTSAIRPRVGQRTWRVPRELSSKEKARQAAPPREPGFDALQRIIASGTPRLSARTCDFELNCPCDSVANHRLDVGLDLGAEGSQGALQVGVEPCPQGFLDELRDVRADRVKDALLEPLLQLQQFAPGRTTLGGRARCGMWRRRGRLGDDLRENRNVAFSRRAGRMVPLQERIGFLQQVVGFGHTPALERS